MYTRQSNLLALRNPKFYQKMKLMIIKIKDMPISKASLNLEAETRLALV